MYRLWAPTDSVSRLLATNLRRQFRFQPPSLSSASASSPSSSLSAEQQQQHYDEQQSIARHTLSSARFRRWATNEMFYSSIDRPYFAQNEFQYCLQDCGHARVTKLTRKNWALVRASMGKPRYVVRLRINIVRHCVALFVWCDMVRL